MKRVKKVVRHTYGHTLNLIAIGAVTLALLLLAGRGLFTLLPQFKDQVGDWLGSSLGQQVRIGQVETAWQGWRPMLRLRDVRFLDGQGQERFHLREMLVTADVPVLLSERRLVPGELRLVGVRLVLERRKDGHLVLGGIPAGAALDAELVAFPSWLLDVRGFRLSDSELVWQDHLYDGAPLLLDQVQASFQGRRKLRHILGSARLPAPLGGRLNFRADLEGPAQDPARWSGIVDIEGQEISAAALAERWHGLPLRLQGGSADLELRLKWRHWRPLRARGHLRVAGLSLPQSGDRPGPRLSLDELDTEFQWLNRDRGWELVLNLESLDMGGQSWPGIGLTLSAGHGEDGRDRWLASVDRLEVGALAQLAAQTGVGGSPLSEALHGLNPRGTLFDLRAAHQQGADDFSYSGHFSGLGIEAWRSFPQLQGVSGSFNGTTRQAQIQLRSRDTTFFDPRLFFSPFRADTLDGVLRWRSNEDGWQLTGNDLLAVNPEVSSRTRLQVNARGDEPVILDIQSEVTGVPARRVYHYLPRKLLSKPLDQWLSRAFQAGQVHRGQFLYHGLAREFPVPTQGLRGDSVFEVRLDARGVDLLPAPGWPLLQDLDAQVIFRDQGLEVELAKGRIFSSRLRSGHGAITDLSAKNPHFELDLKVAGPLEDLSLFLAESPLKQRLAGPLASVRLGGDSELSLSMEGSGKPHIRGEVRLSGNRIEWGGAAAALTDLQGTIYFDTRHVQARSLKGRLGRSPVRIAIDTRAGNQGQGQVQVSGRSSVDELKSLFKVRSLEHLSGAGDWDLDVFLPAGGLDSGGLGRFRLFSDLHGVAVTLPPPLAKSSRQRRPLQVDGRWGAGAPPEIRVAYGDGVGARLRLGVDASSLAALNIHLGSGPVAELEDGELQLTGHLDALSLGDWVELASVPGAAEGWPRLSRVALEITRLQALGRDWHQVMLRLEREPGALVGLISAREVLGSLRLPDDDVSKPMEFNLDRLDIPLAEEGSGGHAAAARSEPNYGKLPPLRMRVRSLHIGAWDLGRLDLSLRTLDQGRELERLILRSPAFTLEAKGRHQINQGGSRTTLRLSLKGRRLGAILDRFGYASGVRGGRTRVDADFLWPGGFADFDLRRLVGTVEINIGKGSFPDLEPGVGRVFGLLSVRSILRRLTLDFSDLFGKGYGFDRIQGKFIMAGGDAYTDDLTLDGPSSRIQISGRVGLIAEDYDQRVRVVPKLTANLPVAGLLAGASPVLGGALLLAQTVFGNQVDRIISVDYSLTGPWRKPVIAELGRVAKTRPKETAKPVEIF